MEIIVEIVVGLLALVAEALPELAIQGLFEGLLRLVQLSFSGWRPDASPLRVWIGNLLHFGGGLAVGALTLLVWPHLAIRHPAFAFANLIVSPVLIGLVMTWLGGLRAKRDAAELPIDRFGAAYLFALGFALARWLWGS